MTLSPSKSQAYDVMPTGSDETELLVKLTLSGEDPEVGVAVKPANRPFAGTYVNSRTFASSPLQMVPVAAVRLVVVCMRRASATPAVVTASGAGVFAVFGTPVLTYSIVRSPRLGS